MGPVHAGLVTIIRRAPQIIVDILIERGALPPGKYRCEVRPTEAWLIQPKGRVSERRVDVALEIRLRRKDDRYGGLIEVQLVEDERKPRRWTKLRLAYESEFGEHLFLVTLTLDEKVEAWLTDFVLPFVDDLHTCLIGPSNFPRWDDFDPKEEPERALFMAMVTPKKSRDRSRRLALALIAFNQFRGNTRLIYREMLLSRFGERALMNARKYYSMKIEDIDAVLERWPGYVPSEDERESVLYTNGHRDGRLAGHEEGCEEGQCIALAQVILQVLEDRGIEVPELARARILAVRDLDTLRGWSKRMLEISDVDALLRG